MPVRDVRLVRLPLWFNGPFLASIHGLIEPDGEGSFIQTDKGTTLKALLDASPLDSIEALAREFLGLEK